MSPFSLLHRAADTVHEDSAGNDRPTGGGEPTERRWTTAFVLVAICMSIGFALPI